MNIETFSADNSYISLGQRLNLNNVLYVILVTDLLFIKQASR